MSSSRLPGKIMKDLCGKPLLYRMIERLKLIKDIDKIIIATSNNPENKILEKIATELNVSIFFGDETDVLKRVLDAARSNQIDTIVQTCGDCPLIEPSIVQNQLNIFLNNNYDYVGSNIKRSFPLGVEARIFSTKNLEKIEKVALRPEDRTNVSYYFYTNPKKFSLYNLYATDIYNKPHYRFVVDYEEDLKLIREIFNNLYEANNKFTLKDVINLVERNPNLLKINQNCLNIEVAKS